MKTFFLGKHFFLNNLEQGRYIGRSWRTLLGEEENIDARGWSESKREREPELLCGARDVYSYETQGNLDSVSVGLKVTLIFPYSWNIPTWVAFTWSFPWGQLI